MGLFRFKKTKHFNTDKVRLTVGERQKSDDVPYCSGGRLAFTKSAVISFR